MIDVKPISGETPTKDELARLKAILSMLVDANRRKNISLTEEDKTLIEHFIKRIEATDGIGKLGTKYPIEKEQAEAYFNIKSILWKAKRSLNKDTKEYRILKLFEDKLDAEYYARCYLQSTLNKFFAETITDYLGDTATVMVKEIKEEEEESK